MDLLTKLFNKKQENLEEKIEKIELAFSELKRILDNKNNIIDKISEDFFEAKRTINQYKNDDDTITDYDGLLLIQEIIDKLLIRFDYYYMNDGEDYPENKMDLIFSKENIARNRNEKFNIAQKAFNAKNDDIGVTTENN